MNTQSNQQHTAGPWHVEIHKSKIDDRENEYNIVFPGIDAGHNGVPKTIDRFVIATVNGYYFGPHTDEPEANARLIAAAPELLAELEHTNRLAVELMERAERIDRMLAEAKGATRDCELGEITRMRGQLSRNQSLITKAAQAGE